MDNPSTSGIPKGQESDVLNHVPDSPAYSQYCPEYARFHLHIGVNLHPIGYSVLVITSSSSEDEDSLAGDVKEVIFSFSISFVARVNNV